MLDLALLGTGGMMPMPNRFLSSMILRTQGKLVLVDCGEGTQVSLKKLGWGFKAIEAIVFTHFHADHISGLPGMLLTIGNAGRREPLRLLGPEGLIDIVEGIRKICPELPYEIVYEELTDKNKKIDLCGMELSFEFACHMVTCLSYRFELKRKGKFNAQKALQLGIPKNLWSVLQKGETVIYEGIEFKPEDVMGESRKGISVAYCTDSRPLKDIVELAKDADIFICEGMYGENEKKQKAIEHFHMLFSEAAQIAKDANVKCLWLTHYSPSLSEPELFIQNATEIFPNTHLGIDGMYTTIFFQQ